MQLWALASLRRSAPLRARLSLDLVDDEEVGLCDPGAALARDFVPASDVNHMDDV